MAELTSLQNSVLDALAKSSLKDSFYWTGGTLLSVLYLHHRRSEDLDFFSDNPFPHEYVVGFVADLKSKTDLDFAEEKKVYDRWEFFLHNKEQVRLEFVHYNYPALNPREKWNGVLVDSLDDVAANKLMAMLDRNEPKDVFDIYFLFTRAEYSPDTLIKLVEKKFGIRLAESLIWSEAFKRMKGLHALKPLMLLETEEQQNKIVEEIRSYFTAQSKKFLDRTLE